MKEIKFATLPGDGIGPEVMEGTMTVLKHIAQKHDLKLTFESYDVGGVAIDNQGTALPESTLKGCREMDAILFGSVGGPKWENLPPKEQPERAALLPLRKAFTLFANIRPGLLYPELVEASPLRPDRIPSGIDIVCIRELTGGIYFGQPKETRTNADGETEALDTMIYKVPEILRIAEVAATAALGRKGKVCSVDKANVLETSVLWRKTVSNFFAEKYPQIELSHMYVDNAAMQLVSDPNQFDVLFTENMFGDILSDELAIICGSIGMLASASLGDGKNGHGFPFGLYEPAGGTAPDIAGMNKANPCAQILSAALMLRYSFGLEDVAREMESAVRETVKSGIRTGDIAFGGKSVSTDTMVHEVLARL